MANIYTFLVPLASLLVIFPIVGSLNCYSCVSTEPGCGKELNIRLQRWHSCPGTGSGGGENFCVKVIRRFQSEEFITRECLMTLRKDTFHRQRMPTVQRHGYCSPGRQNDPNDPYNNHETYCFCNDWNGCNTASGIHSKWTLTALCSVILAIFSTRLA